MLRLLLLLLESILKVRGCREEFDEFEAFDKIVTSGMAHIFYILATLVELIRRL